MTYLVFKGAYQLVQINVKCFCSWNFLIRTQMGRNWEQTTFCSCLFSQSFMSPTDWFTLTSSENTMHQVAREKQQGRFTTSFYFLSSASCFFFACAFSREQNSYQKKIKGNYYVSHSALLETNVCSCLTALLVILKVLETFYFFPTSSGNSHFGGPWLLLNIQKQWTEQLHLPMSNGFLTNLLC